ncbi:hypothetical protein BZG06_16035 [Salinivibrio kushneri]|uniref:Isoprenylcysteine carboxylmethyltransferase family protein n=1 Tax=Salinivibrio kushneri TaxID=1908198 RepID=A0AB36K041_9GAMM|nr:isoprenylcysteine carboxylmethyltransferase family protein [Salinivibrio kushneri]OOE38869.1 hypothetical protein BZG06_16035 [Salinivibrio kushneri]OOE40910.1 hypothetical protein BZG09_16040 [Salinivibrio kushneri]
MKKLLPPILFVLFLICMALLCWGMGSLHTIPYPYNLIGVPFVLLGLWLAISGKRLFKKLNTNIMTFEEPTKLVTQGVFKYSRNPMYLGFAVAMLGAALLTGAAVTSLLLTLAFVLITDRWYIAYEEHLMYQKFGAEYQEYCRNVRRWI